MREDAHAGPRRFTLTGLEGPEELWDRLRESNAEIETLVARNGELNAELQALRRRLRGAGGLSDEELAAELPRRMTRNLAAAQEVAAELVEQANNDVMLIRLNADQLASQVVAGAKAEAARIVRGTMAEAQAHLAAARTQSNDILREAHAQRSLIVAELDDRSARVQAERQRLHDYRQRLEQAYDQVERTLADARAALASGSVPASPAGTGPAAGTARTVTRETSEPRPPSRRADEGQQPPADPPPAEVAGLRRPPDRGRATVFDWSGAPARPPDKGEVKGSKGVTRSLRFAAVDRAAG
jgi:cell division septum initiation protein DivIVA